MKKTFRLTTVLAALLVLFSFSVRAAEDDPFLTVTVPEVNGTAGKNVSVTISVSNAHEMDSLQFRLNYDLACLKLEKAEAGSLLENNGLYVINTDEEGLVALAYASADGLARTMGDVLTLTFKPYNDYGSALTLSGVYASRYNERDGQSKAYVAVEDGGVCFGQNGSVPEPVITPWPVETPIPTPSPTPSPTPLPTAAPSPTPEPTPEPTPATVFTRVKDSLAGTGLGEVIKALDLADPNTLFPILMLLAAIVLIIVTIVIVLVRRGSSERRTAKKGRTKRRYDE